MADCRTLPELLAERRLLERAIAARTPHAGGYYAVTELVYVDGRIDSVIPWGGVYGSLAAARQDVEADALMAWNQQEENTPPDLALEYEGIEWRNDHEARDQEGDDRTEWLITSVSVIP